MKVLHVGAKNYPPAHGGVEKVIFDISNGIENLESYIFVEWPQDEHENVEILPNGLWKQFKAILSFSSKRSISAIHFHKEAFIPHAIWSSIFNNKVLITIHGCAWRLKRWAWYYRFIFYILDIFACIFIPNVIFVSLLDYKHFSKVIFWRKLHFIPNGIEPIKIKCSTDTTKCVFIGRISPEKNILGLIKMFSSDNKKLTIYGPFDKHDKSYEEKVIAAIKSNPSVSYGGILKYTDILSTLSCYNTFYNISFSEGMPVSVLEAASVGLNLVLSNIPQHIDLAFTDVYYVNPFNPDCKCSFEGISENNKIHVIQQYSLSKTIENYRNLYENLIVK